MEALVFDVWGDVGFFRKYFSTSSPLTFPFPPKTTIIGMIAAILGREKDSYYEEFNEENTNIALILKSSINKSKFNTNLLDTKSPPNDYYTQVGFEILKKPAFRIIFHHHDANLMNELEKLLEQHKTTYTLTLGLANCLSNFRFVCKSKVHKQNTEEIDSVIPVYNIEKIMEYGQYFKVKMPTTFNKDRVARGYREYLFERDCNPIKVKTDGFLIENTGERISFM